MRGDDKRIGWTITLIALVVLAVVSLRGYLPDAGDEPRRPPEAGPAVVVAIIVMLGMSIVIVLIAVIAAMRQPKKKSGLMDMPEWRAGTSGGSRRFYLLVGVAAIVFALLILFLGTVGTGRNEDPAAPSTESSESGQNNESSDEGRPAEDLPIDNGPDVLPALLATVIVLTVLMTVGAILVLRRASPAAAAVDDELTGGASESVSDTLARAAELGLAEISDPALDPRAAIIACYAAMERALSDAPDAVPQLSDTPTEVLARAVDHDVLHSVAAAELVGLFTEARFSPHRMTEAQRDSATKLLQLVSADLRSSA